MTLNKESEIWILSKLKPEIILTMHKDEEVQKLEIYIGLKEKKKTEIFVSEKDPTRDTNPKYDIIHGPFKTVKEAENYVNAMGNLACGDG